MSNKHELTPFGIDVRVFCARNGLKLKDLAEMVGIPYITLNNVSRGHRPGHTAIPRTYAFMDGYAAKQSKRAQGGM